MNWKSCLSGNGNETGVTLRYIYIIQYAGNGEYVQCPLAETRSGIKKKGNGRHIFQLPVSMQPNVINSCNRATANNSRSVTLPPPHCCALHAAAAKLRSKFNANKFKLAERRLASGCRTTCLGGHAVFMMAPPRAVKAERITERQRERERDTKRLRERNLLTIT